MSVHEQRTVVTEPPITTPDGVGSRTTTTSDIAVRPSGSELLRRIVVLVFGLIQLVIGARLVLLIIDARTGNQLVSAILDVSKIFVAPFEGMLNTDALKSGGSVLDVAAVVALVGWTILEVIVLWVVGIFRREPA